MLTQNRNKIFFSLSLHRIEEILYATALRTRTGFYEFRICIICLRCCGCLCTLLFRQEESFRSRQPAAHYSLLRPLLPVSSAFNFTRSETEKLLPRPIHCSLLLRSSEITKALHDYVRRREFPLGYAAINTRKRNSGPLSTNVLEYMAA